MAEPKRMMVWMVCRGCGSKNYRTERKTRLDRNKEKVGVGPPACMNGQFALEMSKFCKKCRKHTTHIESKKK